MKHDEIFDEIHFALRPIYEYLWACYEASHGLAVVGLLMLFYTGLCLVVIAYWVLQVIPPLMEKWSGWHGMRFERRAIAEARARVARVGYLAETAMRAMAELRRMEQA